MFTHKFCKTIILFVLEIANTFTIAQSFRSENKNVMCGPNCLWLAARVYGIKTSLRKLRYLAGTNPGKGTSLKGMLKALKALGLEPLLMKTGWKGLDRIQKPAILLLGRVPRGHYVFLHCIKDEKILILDPPNKKTWTKSVFLQQFSGYAVIVCKDNESKKQVVNKMWVQTWKGIMKKLNIAGIFIIACLITVVIIRHLKF